MGLLFAGAAQAAPSYTIEDLGVPTADGAGRTYANAISNSGVVVGHWSSGTAPDEKGLIWDDAGVHGLTLGARTIPRDVNDSGWVVGFYTGASIYDNRAFIFDGTANTDLGTLGGTQAVAMALNNAGTVVGNSQLPNSASLGFVWTNGTMTALPTLGGASSSGNDINDSGTVAGFAQNGAGASRAVIWQDGAPVDLGDLGGGNANGQALNDFGQVAGYSATALGTQHAFLWEAGAMVDLTPGNAGASYAWGINNHGDVVGMAVDSQTGGARPFVWDGQLYDLNTIMAASGWRLYDARRINDAGTIVGSGWNPQGQFRGYVLTPVTVVTPEQPPVDEDDDRQHGRKLGHVKNR